ncbi:MAG: long-chain fatty acid--CoA ligase [Deltaproteobacteria bacterium]|nr:long-chain fatty acid--CoA ligase [Deltaproteobacteria bacterium]
MNIARLLIKGVNHSGDKPAIHFGRQTVSYTELYKRVNRLAYGLTRAGVCPGDVCILMMPNSIKWVAVYYALAKIGAVVVPVNFMYQKQELIHIFKDSAARVFIGRVDHLEQPRLAMRELPEINLLIATGIPAAKGFIALDELFADGEEKEFPDYPVNDGDTWAIVYTSGTTGLPKGAMLSHGNLTSNAMTVAGMRETRPNYVALCVLPLFHIFGQTCVLNAALYSGLTIRMWSKFDEMELLEAIVCEESCFLIAVPTILHRLLTASDRHPPSRSGLRFCISGGASLPVETLHRFQERFHTVIYEGYGLTECSPVCVENPFGQPTRPGSIGIPIPGFSARIVDDKDRELPRGEVGELVVKGPGVMKGYINQPQATARTLRGGWLHTGDLARMDADGYIYIVDRKKDIIIRAGYNVYPREIEEVLYLHPQVAEAAVIGIPDPELGEEIAAVVVPRSGARITAHTLKQFVKKRVAPYKYPRKIYLVDELPKSHTGKILKRPIRLKD